MKLILIRGLPGSGKSALARNIAYWASSGPNYYTWRHFEADMFFMSNGEYKYDKTKIVEAHAWCRVQTALFLSEGDSVIVANTFTRRWEMNPYIEMAKQYGAELTVLTVEGNHGNVHGVPEEVIEKMRKRWEPYRD